MDIFFVMIKTLKAFSNKKKYIPASQPLSPPLNPNKAALPKFINGLPEGSAEINLK